MLLLAAALVLSAAVASASDDPGGGGEGDKRADGYAMAWRKGKRFSPVADAVSPLYGARYVLRQPIR